MIKVNAIKLPAPFDIYKNTDNEKAEFLEPVSKINIFVGSNNSGKSRFMRHLSMQADFDIKKENLEKLSSIILEKINYLIGKFDSYGLLDTGTISVEYLKTAHSLLTNTLNTNSDKYEELRNSFTKWSKISGMGGYTSRGSMPHRNLEHLPKIIRDTSLEALELINNIPIYSEATNPKKVYIPTLRGLRPLDNAHTDFYLDKTRQDYFEHQTHGDLGQLEAVERKNPEVFTGLSLYKRITDLLLGNNSERRLITDYQKFISEKLFEENEVELIPNQKDKVVIVRIGNEKEQPIHHLGDGIQSAIILSFLPFVVKEQTFFFIEEPEMYLHPGLQRKILNFYNSQKCENHTFFLTTHSNHFLDITIDIKDVSIFTFRKIFDESDEEERTPNFTIEAVDSGCESSLELLGVRNSSVFLVNATIWVEGITDRWYLRKMLNSYMDYLEEANELDLRLEEDAHYSFVEYGGANITHWSFLDYEEHPIEVGRLCAKAIVIIDKDGEKKEKRKDDLEEILGERLIILPCREVENLLPYKVIKEVVMEYENNSELELKEFGYDKYQNEYLGRFIEDKMLKKSPSRKGGYKAESGTLKDKVKFCEKALTKIKYEELPNSTKEIIQGIYKFVYAQNS